jgi:hypothetical protein
MYNLVLLDEHWKQTRKNCRQMRLQLFESILVQLYVEFWRGGSYFVYAWIWFYASCGPLMWPLPALLSCYNEKVPTFLSFHWNFVFLQVNMLKHVQSNGSLHIDPGYCLKCGSYCDLEPSLAAVNKSWISIRRYITLYLIEASSLASPTTFFLIY